MTIYLVMVMTEFEYGGREVEKAFYSEEKAKDYIKDKQRTIDNWYGEDELYTIEEIEIE